MATQVVQHVHNVYTLMLTQIHTLMHTHMHLHSLLFEMCCISLLQGQHGILVTHVDGKVYDSMFAASSDEWRKRRRALSPAFSAHKMKLVSLHH